MREHLINIFLIFRGKNAINSFKRIEKHLFFFFFLTAQLNLSRRNVFDVCLSAIGKIPSSWLGRRRRVTGPLRRSAPALHGSAFPHFCGSWASRAVSGRCGFPLAVPAPCSVDSALSHPRPSSGSALTFLGTLSLRLAPHAPSLWFPSKPRNLPVRAVSVACMWCRSCIVRICPRAFSRRRFRSLRAGAVPHHGAGNTEGSRS